MERCPKCSVYVSELRSDCWNCKTKLAGDSQNITLIPCVCGFPPKKAVYKEASGSWAIECYNPECSNIVRNVSKVDVYKAWNSLKGNNSYENSNG